MNMSIVSVLAELAELTDEGLVRRLKEMKRAGAFAGSQKMKPSKKKAWIAALRSGAYQQIEGALRRPEGFCCLGVLCNLHAQAHPKIAAKQLDPDMYMGHDGHVPPPVREWAGLETQTGAFRLNGLWLDFTDLNDSYGFSFKQIAAMVEAAV